MKIELNLDERVDTLHARALDYWPTDKLLHIRRQDKQYFPENLCGPESKNDCTFYRYSGGKDILATVEPLTKNIVPVQNPTVRWGIIYRTVHKEHPSYQFARTATIKEDHEYQRSPGEQDWVDTYLPRKEDSVGFCGDYYHGYFLSTFEKGACAGGTSLPTRPVTVVLLSTEGKISQVHAVISPQQYATYDVRDESTRFSTKFFAQFENYENTKHSAFHCSSKEYPYKGPVGNWKQLRRDVLVRIIDGIAEHRKPVLKTSVKHMGLNIGVTLARAVIKKSPVEGVKPVAKAPVKRTVVEELKERHEKEPKLPSEKV